MGTFDMLSEVMAGPLNVDTGRKPRIAVVTPGKDDRAADPSVDGCAYLHGPRWYTARPDIWVCLRQDVL
ncbi:hypothetical protein ACJZ2D_014074 [Fusarium nematophilum]